MTRDNTVMLTVNGKDLLCGKMSAVTSLSNIIFADIDSFKKCASEGMRINISYDYASGDLKFEISPLFDLDCGRFGAIEFSQKKHSSDIIFSNINGDEMPFSRDVESCDAMFTTLASFISYHTNQNIRISFDYDKKCLSMKLLVNGLLIDNVNMTLVNADVPNENKSLKKISIGEPSDKNNLPMKLIREFFKKNDINIADYHDKFDSRSDFNNARRLLTENNELSWEMFERLCGIFGLGCAVSIGSTPFNSVHAFLPNLEEDNDKAECGTCRECARLFLREVNHATPEFTEQRLTTFEKDGCFGKGRCVKAEVLIPEYAGLHFNEPRIIDIIRKLRNM